MNHLNVVGEKWQIALLLILILVAPACGGGGDAPWIGLWKLHTSGYSACSECTRVNYLRVDSNTLSAMLNVDECTIGSRSVVSGVFNIDTSSYVVDGDKIFVKLQSSSTGSQAFFNCSGDQLIINGVGAALGGGTWDRVSPGLEPRITPLFLGKCSGWDRCLGPGISVDQCTTPADCLTPPTSKQSPSCTDKKCSVPIC